jgi:hypothetical protein
MSKQEDNYDDEIDKLRSLYYDPKVGLTGLTKLYMLAKKNDIKLTHKQIKDWYDNEAVNQIYRNKTKVQHYKIECRTHEPGCIQVDLKDVSKFARKNKGYHFLLNMIDVYSRYNWVFPI